MTLKCLKVNNFCEKKLKEISFRLQTCLSLLAMRGTLKTNVKRFEHPPANLAVYSTGQQKKIDPLSNR